MLRIGINGFGRIGRQVLKALYDNHGDVAQVVESVEDVRAAGYVNGKPSVMLVIFRQPGANIIETVDGIRALLPRLEANLPGGMALLHARHHEEYSFDGSFLLLGRTIAGIPFGAQDGGLTRLFFMLCCQDERLHLHTLARLCMMASKTDLLAQLWHAPDADSAHAILGECEQTTLLGKKHEEAETEA